ncbi:DNA-binding transcriptional MerR regulator [Paucibacter oligotrophus]|uniref:DNA-binding transcriptional MerR regulator n=1 Tax=Roseateles oligotrophus TaxID=1769250 RepID=A0A840LAX9_9BURK|nr:MerR family transcriptional regulator [Roseateles oligotrophus]MBB4843279.1 DNA-binding transcriptional MerR regulator [Roseateles oligotrophus]
MNISQLALASQLTPDTLRYYEKLGLLAAAPRQANGYRRYTAAHLETLQFIRGAQALGFSLKEIQAVLSRPQAGGLKRPELEALLGAKLQEIERQQAQLQALKLRLNDTLASLRCPPEAELQLRDSRSPQEAPGGPGVSMLKRSFPKRRTPGAA